MSVEEILQNEEIVSKLEQVESEAEFCQILLDYGASEDVIKALIEKIVRTEDEGELSENALEDVAGGGYIHRMMFRMVYRFKHKKLFVKATEDKKNHVITVQNRFGKKVIEYETVY